MDLKRCWTRRLMVPFAALSIAAVAVTILTVPALAQQLQTTTTSFVNFQGHTVTIETTFVDGLLTMRHLREVSRQNTPVLERTMQYWPNGRPRAFVERGGLSGSAPYTIRRTFDQNGILRAQYAELMIKGQVVVQSWTALDARGLLISKEERVLSTRADGTKVWRVTAEKWSPSVLVSRAVSELPLGTVFTTPGTAQP